MDYTKYDVEYPADRTKENMAAYREQERATRKAFKFDLETEFHIPHDAVWADTLFNMAWEHGHSAGYHEVHFYYDDFAALVHQVLDAKDHQA